MCLSHYYIIFMNVKGLIEFAKHQESKIKPVDHSIYEAQLNILQEILESNDTEEMQNRINQIDAQIDDCDMKIQRYQRAYIELLQNISPHSPSEEKKEIVSENLKFAFNEVQNQLEGLCRMTVDGGAINLPITAICDVENQIMQIIDDFKDDGSFIETEEQLQNWNYRLQQHNDKVMGFMSSLFPREDYSDSDDF